MGKYQVRFNKSFITTFVHFKAVVKHAAICCFYCSYSSCCLFFTTFPLRERDGVDWSSVRNVSTFFFFYHLLDLLAFNSLVSIDKTKACAGFIWPVHLVLLLKLNNWERSCSNASNIWFLFPVPQICFIHCQPFQGTLILWSIRVTLAGRSMLLILPLLLVNVLFLLVFNSQTPHKYFAKS